jgi:hypothetical protein
VASYPTAVFSPTSKNSGDTIQAAHVNDVQAEITAVEDALKNGIAHAVTISTGGLTVSTGSVNIGGPSSLATLQVNGGSTFVGTVAMSSNLTVAGDSTIAGSLTVSGTIEAANGVTVGGVSVVGRLPGARLTLAAAAVAINSGAWTGLGWTTEEYDSTGLHSTASNSSRVNLTSSGLWSFGGEVTWAIGSPASTTIVGVRVLANDATALVGHYGLTGSPSVTQWPVAVSGMHYATSTTTYLTFQVLQTGGGSMDATGSTGSGGGPTHFWVQKVSV